jgi:hypothetical protein
MSRLSRLSFLAPALALGLFAGSSAAQGPAMPDPRTMSGMPRIDPQTEPGTIVIRVLRGSFQEPGVGLTVSLALRSADGARSETRTAVSVEQGRATFGDLMAYAGGTAVASVDFEGEKVQSQELRVDPSVGVRMLLVKQGPGGSAPAGAPASAPASDVPRPGVPFPNPGQEKGTVVVGTLDLGGGRPFTGVEVRLEITPPGGQPQVRRIVSDDRGAARFNDLKDLPPGSTLVAEATLAGQVRRSESFVLEGQEHGLAVVLAVTGSAPATEERRPLQPPRALPTIPPGTVRVSVSGPDDGPVAAAVTVIKIDVTGMQQRFVGRAGADGVALVADIDLADDSLYRVEVEHHGAPFRSRLFQMNDRMGVAVELRVFPVTSDLGKLRSAVQFGIEALENDQARVVQLHQAIVEGEAAFWPTTPLKISGPLDAKGLVVLDRATVDLDHKEGAPFATLNEPIPPGEVVDLSVAYLMPHHGSLTLRWPTPFPVETGRAVLTPDLKITRGALGPPVRPPHQEGQMPDNFDVYDLGKLPLGGSFELTVEGLATTPRIFRQVGLGLGVLIALGTALALALRPRASLKQRLERRRDVLLKALERSDAALAAREPGAAEARERVIYALDQVYRQLDVFAGTGPNGQVTPGAGWEAKS